MIDRNSTKHRKLLFSSTFCFTSIYQKLLIIENSTFFVIFKAVDKIGLNCVRTNDGLLAELKDDPEFVGSLVV